MKNKKIYVICPAGVQTGGTELLHQLVHELLRMNSDAYIVYEDKGNFVDAEIPNSFKEYRIQRTSFIEDNQNNIVVLPEVLFYHSRKFAKVHFLFWWLSVDNYYHNSASHYDYIKFYLRGIVTIRQVLSHIKWSILNKDKIFSFREIKSISSRVLHGYQSSYASHELLNYGFYKQIKLTDYINTDYLINKTNLERKNIILYNPAKGFKVTQKIMKNLPDIEFVPLKQLSREQMLQKFREAKLYIDFGNHPGKDRIPREACANGCCIIVGKRGSAQYFEDISIPEEYKFDEKRIEVITLKIREVLKDYNEHNTNFEYYRNNISNEYKRFVEEVEELNRIVNSL